jgi:tRNA/rRNA methyltransferase
MASGAGRVLDRAALFATTAEAVGDLTVVFATTARDRAMTKRVLTPEGAMAEARALAAAGERVGILFGPERAGLANEDVLRAGAVVSVPTNPAYPSLNLAQAALLMAYEWRRSAGSAAENYRLGDRRLASGAEVDRFLAHLAERLDAVGFFFPEDKRPSMLANLENLFRRTPLTDADVRTLHGVVRALAIKQPGRKPL